MLASLEYMGIKQCIKYQERHNLLTDDTFIVKDSVFIWRIDIFIRNCCKRNEPTALHFAHGTNSFKMGENVVHMSLRKGAILLVVVLMPYG